MPAIINSSNQIELQGSDSGWSRAKIAMPAAPTGTTNAIYVMRYWLDEFSPNTTQNIEPPFETAAYSGFHFGSSFPANLTVAGTGSNPNALGGAYADFWPAAPAGSSASSLAKIYIACNDTTSINQDYATFGRSSLYLINGNGNASGVLFDGNFTVTNNKTVDELPFTVPVNPTVGQTATMIWQVYSDETDETVYSRYWVNTDSVSLDSFDIEADIDPSDPYAAFPISNSWSRTGEELNGSSSTGTNWRPSSGVMGFPTYYMARYPYDEQSLVIDYVGVHYSEATVT